MNFRNALLWMVPFLLLAAGCVGKKKFLREVELRRQHETEIQALKEEIAIRDEQAQGMQLQLAEKAGEVKGLHHILEQKEKEIQQLEDRIEELSNRALSQQELLAVALQEKVREIENKERLIQDVRDALAQQRRDAQALLKELADSLLTLEKELAFSTEVEDQAGRLSICADHFFLPSSTHLTSAGASLLEKISQVLNRHPEITIVVEGHTDNSTPKPKTYRDNWDLSALRATAIVRYLTEEREVNPSQIEACSHGEFAPKASNATEEGKKQNRRMDFLLRLPPLDIAELLTPSGRS
ncbi:MAG: hypothetical protein D6765_09720 [Bacteroidetes bacterium]|nr:MAG: hypothetical protein D6765_09720 [Bacteroidota bacterium]